MKKNKKFSIVSKILFLSCLLLALPLQSFSQSAKMPFKGHFYEENEKVHLMLDLNEATLDIPGMSFLGKVHGYMQGNIYGVWMLTSFKIKGEKAMLRFSNDSGADSQSIAFTLINDSTFKYEAIGGNCVKRVHRRKLVKIPSELIFTKLK